jgi:hypothetical protein
MHTHSHTCPRIIYKVSRLSFEVCLLFLCLLSSVCSLVLLTFTFNLGTISLLSFLPIMWHYVSYLVLFCAEPIFFSVHFHLCLFELPYFYSLILMYILCFPQCHLFYFTLFIFFLIFFNYFRFSAFFILYFRFRSSVLGHSDVL